MDKKSRFKNYFNREWDYGNISPKTIRFGFLKFSKLYNRDLKATRCFVAIIMGVLVGFFSFFLLQGTGIYSLGITGLFQGISRLVFSMLKLNGSTQFTAEIVYYINFWVLNLIFNILLGFYGYLKIGKQFTILSILSIFSSSVVGLILSFIPGLSNFYIFSDALTFDSSLLKYNVQILQWSQTGDKNDHNDSSRIAISFVYAVMAGIVTTVPATVVYIIGGGNGGTDWYLFYYSKKTMRSFALYSMYWNFVLTFLSYVIGTYVPYIIVNNRENLQISVNHLIQNFFSPILLSSFLYAIIRRNIIKSLYPQFKVVLVKIYTDKVLEMRQLILDSNFPHTFTINKSTGGYSLENHPNMEIICFYKEIPEIMRLLNIADENALITASSIKTIKGLLNIKSDFD